MALNGARCAVAVAPAGHRQQSPCRSTREIGVGYDGSPESEQASRSPARSHTRRRRSVSAFRVVAVPGYVFHGRTAVDGTLIKDLVDEARAQIAAFDGIEPHAAYGDVAEELALYSASLDLLVLGSRGYGPLGRLVHGRTTQQLARTARCPLLVLTRGAREAPESGGSEVDRATASPRDLKSRPDGVAVTTRRARSRPAPGAPPRAVVSSL